MNRLLILLAGTIIGYVAGGYLDGLMEETETSEETEA